MPVKLSYDVARLYLGAVKFTTAEDDIASWQWEINLEEILGECSEHI